MKTHISARIDETLAHYLQHYQQQHRVKSRSEVLEIAIKALRDQELKREYALAMDEWTGSADAGLWDKTAGDGLNDEAW